MNTSVSFETVPMSEYPDESANWYWEDEWVESKKICLECHDVKMWQAG